MDCVFGAVTKMASPYLMSSRFSLTLSAQSFIVFVLQLDL